MTTSYVLGYVLIAIIMTTIYRTLALYFFEECRKDKKQVNISTAIYGALWIVTLPIFITYIAIAFTVTTIYIVIKYGFIMIYMTIRDLTEFI